MSLQARAARAAERWGDGAICARDLINAIGDDERKEAAEYGADWWEPFTLMIVRQKRGEKITDPGWSSVAEFAAQTQLYGTTA